MKTTSRKGTASVTLACLLAVFPGGAAPPEDFDRFLSDPQCGSKASLDSLGQFFQSQRENLVALGGIAGKVADAALAAAPAAVESGRILTEAAGLAPDAAAAGPKARQQLDALQKAIQTLQKETGQIAALNLTTVAADGAALVGTVGSFLGECAGCAAAMAGAIGAASGGLLAAVGSTACSTAMSDLARLQDTVSKSQRFVDSTIKLVQAVRNSIAALVDASDAFVKLGQELGKKSLPRLARIEASLNDAIDALNRASTIAEDDVAPRVVRLGGDLLTQIGDNARKLVACHEKMHAHSSLPGSQAQKRAPRGNRFVPPRIAVVPFAPLKSSVARKNIVRVKLGPLPAR